MPSPTHAHTMPPQLHASGNVHHWAAGLMLAAALAAFTILAGAGGLPPRPGPGIPAALAILAEEREPAGGPAQVTLDRLVVVQAIQNLENRIDLVAGKETWVRAFLSSDQQLGVQGTLLVKNTATRARQRIPSINHIVIKPAQNAELAAKAMNLGATLNFRIPDSLVAEGQIELSIDSVSVAGMTGRIACIDCLRPRGPYALRKVPPLRVRIIGLEYGSQLPNGTAINYTPRDIDYTRLETWLRHAFPVSQVITSREVIRASKAPPYLTCTAVNAQLQGIRQIEMEDPRSDRRTHYYGLVYDGGLSYLSMRGCATGIPRVADPSTVASGPTGTPTGPWAQWDRDGSYGDWYAGHELGHTMGRRHLGICTESPDDVVTGPPYPMGYPRPEGKVGAGEEGFFGLEVGDAGPKVLPGDTWRDVMTYCDFQWISPYTYTAILERLIEENESSFGNTPPLLASEQPDQPEDLEGRPTPGLPTTTAATTAEAPAGLFFMSGTFNLTRQTGEIITLVPTTAADDSPGHEGPAIVRPLITVQLKGRQGTVLKELPADVRFDSDAGTPGQPRDSTGVFKAVFQADPAVELIEVHMAGVPAPIASHRRPAVEPAVTATNQVAAGQPGTPTRITLSAPGKRNQKAVYTVVAFYDNPPPGVPPVRVLKNDDDPELILPVDVFGNQDQVRLKITVSNGLESSVQVMDIKRFK